MKEKKKGYGNLILYDIFIMCITVLILICILASQVSIFPSTSYY